MAYDVYLEHGFPIAPGVIEGAYRCVVKDRMERSGMRWIISGARAMLDMRCIVILFEIRTLRPYRYYYIYIFLNVLQLL
jgi:hypothetical protein